MKRIYLFLTLLLGTLTVATSVATAEWSQDPMARTPICTADGAQRFTELVAVEDGFVAAWDDQRRGSCGYNCIFDDVYAQKFSIEGEMLWPENGRVIAEGPAGSLVKLWQHNTGLADGGEGSVLIAWNDSYPGYYEQGFVTRAASNTTVAWGAPGETIQEPDSAVPMLAYPVPGGNVTSRQWNIATDSEGGIFVPVDVATTGWLARFDTEGRLRAGWVSNPSENQKAYYPLVLIPVVEPSGEDGVVIVWQNDLGYGWSILASKRIDPETSWPNAPDTFDSVWEMVQLHDVELTDAYRLVAVPDGSGGVIAAWMDNRTGKFRVYAQRVDADGNLSWHPGGITVSGDLSSSHTTYELTMAADSEGGAVIAWNDPISDILRVLKAQRLDVDGEEQWAAGGVVVASDQLSNYSPLNVALVRATDGNFILLYGHPFVTNVRPAQLLAQKLAKSDGGLLWGEGRTVFEYDGPYYSAMSDHVKMVSDGHAGAIVAFATGDGDIRAHRVEELPDLTVNSIKAPRMLRAGKTVTVRVTIGNAGRADVTGTYVVSLFLDDDMLKEDGVSDAPAAGDETVVTMSGVHIPDLSSGNHSLEAIVDTYAAISESDEDNNTESINVKVK